MDIYNETRFLMKKYNITANKRLGQNFLIDDEIVNKIIEASHVNEEDLIIEIGPGLGTLTKPLLEKAGKVICIELDMRMIEILRDRFSLYNNFEILNNDVLKVDLNKLIQEEKNDEIKEVKIVANLPYYITTPIVMKLLEDRLDIKSIVVMVQKEVAERLISIPGEGESGAITYAINYYTNADKITDVSNECFLPMPEVKSSVIRLEVLEKPRTSMKNEKILFKVIKLAFMQKRKTLLNALTNGNLFESKQKVENMLKELGFDLKIRGEKLSLEDFTRIADYVSH